MGKLLENSSFGLKVRPLGDGHRSLSASECILRTFGHLICVAGGMIPYALALFRRDRRGLQDWMSGCEVVFESDHNVEEEKELLAA